MTDLYFAFAATGAAVLALALLARPIEERALSAPLLMAVFGILLGPLALDLMHPAQWGERHRLVEETARITLAISLMGVALRLPRSFFRLHWRSLATLIGLGMLLMCLASSLLSYWLLDVSLLVALLIGAVVTPTDPVVASSIVTGSVAERNLPAYYRRTLSAESGANDGLAYPLVMLPILLLHQPAAEALSEWVLHALLLEVGGAVLVGIVFGIGAGRLLTWAERHGYMEQSSFLGYTLALTLLALGLAHLTRIEPLVTVFVTGVTFDQIVGGRERSQEESVQEAVNQFFTLPIFGLFGMLLPWEAWVNLGWPALALAVAILALRRVPAVLVLGRAMPVLRHPTKDSLYLGWFGPIGVAAMLYAATAVRHTGEDIVWTVSSLVIMASLIAHGASATPLAKRYGRRNGER